MPGSDAVLTQLSDRQREVLALMAQGASNAAIARKLSITKRAVVQHCSNIYEQLGLRSSDGEHRRVLAVLCYLAAGRDRYLVTLMVAAARLLRRLGRGWPRRRRR